MKITVKTLGAKLTLEITNGTSYEGALEIFARMADVHLKGMDVYADGKKVEDITSAVADDVSEIQVLKSKHESAAIKLTVKTLGKRVTVECDDDANCDDALKIFERLTETSLEGMDVYKEGNKVADRIATKVENGDELQVLKSKHESA